ncbi:MAG: barstar family protein, partial [Pseudanabaena sp.]
MDWRTIVKLQIRLEDEHPETSWIHLRGTKMRTVTGFFNEIAAAFQFPVWFGENWDAFIDIVRDRSWLSGTIVTVYDANLLLIDATGKDRANLADVLNLCNRYGEDTYATIETDLNDEDGFHLL